VPFLVQSTLFVPSHLRIYLFYPLAIHAVDALLSCMVGIQGLLHVPDRLIGAGAHMTCLVLDFSNLYLAIDVIDHDLLTKGLLCQDTFLSQSVLVSVHRAFHHLEMGFFVALQISVGVRQLKVLRLAILLILAVLGQTILGLSGRTATVPTLAETPLLRCFNWGQV